MFGIIKDFVGNMTGWQLTGSVTIVSIIAGFIMKKTGIKDWITKLINKADAAIELLDPVVDAATKKGSYNGGVKVTHKMNNSWIGVVYESTLEPLLIMFAEGVLKLALKCVTVFIVKPISNAIAFFVTGLRSDNKEVKK